MKIEQEELEPMKSWRCFFKVGYLPPTEGHDKGALFVGNKRVISAPTEERKERLKKLGFEFEEREEDFSRIKGFLRGLSKKSRRPSTSTFKKRRPRYSSTGRSGNSQTYTRLSMRWARGPVTSGRRKRRTTYPRRR